ncbi:MAG: TMEM165/GDT1 family protein [Coriobacteriia bacterium]
MLAAFTVAAVLVALAELGDKTQMLTLVLASRYRGWQVLAGVTAAVLGLQLLATAFGRAVGGLVPERVLAVVTGLLFIGFGLWTLRPGPDEDAEEEADRGSRFGPILAVAAAFFLAELGDKTQVLTMSIAADPGAAARPLAFLGGWLRGPAPSGTAAFLGVWFGSTLGMVAVNSLSIVAGAAIGKRLPRRVVARVSGVVFILFGVATLMASTIRA